MDIKGVGLIKLRTILLKKLICYYDKNNYIKLMYLFLVSSNAESLEQFKKAGIIETYTNFTMEIDCICESNGTKSHQFFAFVEIRGYFYVCDGVPTYDTQEVTLIDKDIGELNQDQIKKILTDNKSELVNAINKCISKTLISNDTNYICSCIEDNLI